MASRKLTSKAYIQTDKGPVLWYEIDENGKVTWHLPKEIGKKYRDKMLENISKFESKYLATHPNSALWDV